MNIPLDKPLIVHLTDAVQDLGEVVVTATRTSRSISNVPMPVQVVGSSEIKKIGSLRLNEVLQEQTGLQINSDHGTGLQMQGLNSEYILILIDGEPVVGRTAGTLELNRLAVDNIERIEVIKGPSSSLYGSEAMAGVVNIITKTPVRGFSTTLRSRYRSFGTSNSSATVGYAGKKLTASLFADHLSTKGYDLTDNTVSMTAPPFQAFTLNPKVAYRFSKAIKFSINGRFFVENQKNVTDLVIDDETVRVDDKGRREDWNLMPTLEINLNERHRTQFRSYNTGYRTETDLRHQSDGLTYDANFFDQHFGRLEVQHDWSIDDHHITTFGAGRTRETVEATRYDDVNTFNATYGFVQHQWMVNDRLNLIAGGRYDAHSEYASRFSPKLAAGYAINDWLKVQASFGGGYKAPDFRQLLLNFTNPVAGYTVVGSSVVKERMAELQAQGQIATVLIDPNSIETIQAETSLAYNVGLRFAPGEKVRGELNLYRNDINNLINTMPIARKTNGQSVFSYLNLNQVVTQGVEVSANYELGKNVELAAGYQYLDSRDVKQVERIKNGEVFRRDPATNRTTKVTLADYGGLPSRSRHSGNAKIFYTNPRHQFDVSLRAIFRGRWGLGDSNGNGLVDADSEFAKGYLLLNLALNKKVLGWLTLEAGANNLLSTTNTFEPSLPGRIWYGGINVNFQQKK